jgi:AcrR family transcriptional regulator
MNRELSPAIRESRRDRILQVATDVFLEDGYAATAMSAISQRLGGSKATLYAYFPNKEDLLEAIILRQCQILFAALDQAEALPGISERLARLGTVFMGVLASEAGIRTMQLCIEVSRHHPEFARRFEEVSIRVITDQLTALLEQADARGEIHAPDPMLAANTFISLMRGDLHFRRLLNLIPEPAAASVETEARTAVALFLRAFAPRASPQDI